MKTGASVESADAGPLRVTPASPVLTALRAATLERHRVVDRSMPLSGAAPTHHDYIDHLRLMRNWLSPLEGWLDGPTTLQTALIDADLADFGVLPEPERQFEPEPAPQRNRWGRWPPNAGAFYRWGTRYVIEGSRLGANVLYRRLQYTLRPHKLSYLRGADESASDRWPTFLRELRIAVKAPEEVAEACLGACDGFDALLALLARRQSGFQRAGAPR